MIETGRKLMKRFVVFMTSALPPDLQIEAGAAAQQNPTRGAVYFVSDPPKADFSATEAGLCPAGRLDNNTF